MMYPLLLYYKEKHEKSVGTCSRPTIPLGWQCINATFVKNKCIFLTILLQQKRALVMSF